MAKSNLSNRLLTKKTNRRVPVTCVGGPFDGEVIKLYSPGTMQFRVSSFDSRAGRYDRDGIWEFVE